MNEVIEELKYIDDYMEFSSGISDNIKKFLFDNSFVFIYDGIVGLTQKGMNYLSNNKRNYNLEDIEFIEDSFDEYYDSDEEYLKGFEYED